MRSKRLLAILTSAALAGAAVSVWLVLSGRPEGSSPGSTGPGGPVGPQGENAPSFKPAERAPAWAALAPEGTILLLGTSDLPALAAELRAGPAGKMAAAPSVQAFLQALADDPGGPAGEIYTFLKLGLDLAEISDGAAFLAGWRDYEDDDLKTALTLRIKPTDFDRAFVRVEAALKPAVAIVRREPAGAGQICKTAAPAGSEGCAWGRSGDWLVMAGSVAGCKRMLDCVARPVDSVPREDVAGALTCAGDGRLVGGLDARGGLTAGMSEAIGWQPAGWLGYSAGPGPDGRWVERFLLDGRPTQDGGLLGTLAAGGERPVLAGLPDSTLACLTANVSDGAGLWTRLGRALATVDPDRVVERAAAALAGASGREFAKDVAPALRGEVTIGWTLQRQALYPQVLIGAGLVPGAGAKLGDSAVPALALFGDGGRVETADYAGVRMSWLQGHSPANPSCPAPCCAFQGDRLLAASSTVPLKEHFSGRGPKWLSAAEARRLSSGLLGARADLRSIMPFAAALAGDLGLEELLPVGVEGLLPNPEELAEHLGAVELVAGRSKAGLWAELRGPLPLGAAGVLFMNAE